MVLVVLPRYPALTVRTFKKEDTVGRMLTAFVRNEWFSGLKSEEITGLDSPRHSRKWNADERSFRLGYASDPRSHYPPQSRHNRWVLLHSVLLQGR